jgi:hypothetical protein
VISIVVAAHVAAAVLVLFIQHWTPGPVDHESTDVDIREVPALMEGIEGPGEEEIGIDYLEQDWGWMAHADLYQILAAAREAIEADEICMAQAFLAWYMGRVLVDETERDVDDLYHLFEELPLFATSFISSRYSRDFIAWFFMNPSLYWVEGPQPGCDYAFEIVSGRKGGYCATVMGFRNTWPSSAWAGTPCRSLPTSMGRQKASRGVCPTAGSRSAKDIPANLPAILATTATGLRHLNTVRDGS